MSFPYPPHPKKGEVELQKLPNSQLDISTVIKQHICEHLNGNTVINKSLPWVWLKQVMQD